MLIKVGRSKDSAFTPSPFKDEPGKKTPSPQAPALRLRTLPDNDGRRIVPTAELFSRINSDPALRAAISTVQREYGAETGIHRAVRKQMVHDRISSIHAAVTKRAIDLQISKQKLKDTI